MIDNSYYITTGDRIDGRNAPDGREDILNKPLTELMRVLQDGGADGSLTTLSIDLSDYTISEDVIHNDFIGYNSTLNTIVKASAEFKPFGVIDLNKNIIYTHGKVTLETYNSLVIGKQYYLNNNSELVTINDSNRIGYLIGTAINSNQINLQINRVLSESELDVVIDDLVITNENTYSSEKIESLRVTDKTDVEELHDNVGTIADFLAALNYN